MLRLLLLTCLLISCTTVPSADQSYIEANDAFRRGDITQSFTLFQDAAERGDITSAYMLGLFYASGTGVDIDDTKAYTWFLVAMSRGNIPAEIMANTVYPKLTVDDINEANSRAMDILELVQDTGEKWQL